MGLMGNTKCNTILQITLHMAYFIKHEEEDADKKEKFYFERTEKLICNLNW